jgi:tetratricopeptide (TPR) repeat protein
MWLAATFGEKTQQNAKERLSAVTELLRLADSLRWLSFGEQLKMRLGSAGTPADQLPLTRLLSPEELAAAGKQLVEEVPARGATAASLAVFHQQAGRWNEASQFWEKAVAAISADQTKQRAWVQVQHARALAKAGDRDAAHEVFARVKRQGMGKAFLDEYRKVEKELQIPAANGEKEASQPEPTSGNKEAA